MSGDTERIKICWMKEKQEGRFVCFIPLTIDGVGKTADQALKNLEVEAGKIVSTLKAARVKCGFSVKMVHQAVSDATWWYKDGACKKWKKDVKKEA